MKIDQGIIQNLIFPKKYQLDFWKIYKIKYYDSLESLQLPTYIMAGSSKTVLGNK